MKRFWHKHTPSEWTTYKKYFKIALPIIVAGFIFSLNNFVDNFMVGTIPGGVSSLAIANTWTGILISLFYGVSYALASAFAQFYGKSDFSNARNVIKIRIIIMTSLALILATAAWIFPSQMILLFLPSAESSPEVLEGGTQYLRLIAISWVLLAGTTLYSQVLRETENGKWQLIIVTVQIISNISINAILIFGVGFGVQGAAVGTIISSLIALTFLFTVSYKKNKNLNIKIWRIFKIRKIAWKIFFKRLPGGIFSFLAVFSIYFRSVFWNFNYEVGQVGEPIYELSAASIFGISLAITSMFLSSLESVTATVGIFVGWNLGKNKIEDAKKHAHQIKLFNCFVGVGIIPFIIAFVVAAPYLTFLTSGEYIRVSNIREFNGVTISEAQALINATNAQAYILKNVQLNIVPYVLLTPLWLWIYTSIVALSQGKRATLVGIIDALINVFMLGVQLILWAINANVYRFEVWQAFWIFTVIEVSLACIYEILYYKISWSQNIVNIHKKEQKGATNLETVKSK
ncbi:MATE family efflux transporter [Mycoplasmopsis agassizii]|uniref:Probable multidrug resistance protein NorM n=1 Tax=Mycoplasmopsis agassizii TaxID=33922 RepID=A0ABX4H4S3_9BACT|nr:MATE family efflux transporter [Mycoplasmopsis agassizii]PAF54895.1 MATE family efflux transporter [Mycoplasmopsis agassizii]SMC17260.1 Na+-driven multidrug efflux pump [Mycoplasmopsis agassizii]